MHKTPRSSRLHIALFGRRNTGKSSLINALTGQELAIVSPIPGTTTDPVYKSMEIPGIGPVELIDTAGLDDVGELGQRRIDKSIAVLDQTDLALLVVSAEQGFGEIETELLRDVKQKKIPVIGIINKIDLVAEGCTKVSHDLFDSEICWVKTSALTGRGIEELVQLIITEAPQDWARAAIAGDLLSSGDLALLVTPIDGAAPQGRLILPQVQTIRDLLDHECLVLIAKDGQLRKALERCEQPPSLVITDSQVFKEVDAIIPSHLPLTSFSILFARYKGDLGTLVRGVLTIKDLKPGDKVLIAEACTHHRVEDDIGTVKIPHWLREYAGGELDFTWASGGTLPGDLQQYRLIVHCGACMINRRQMLSRIIAAGAAGVPIVNYGVLIAFVHGILERTLAPFPDMLQILKSQGD